MNPEDKATRINKENRGGKQDMGQVFQPVLLATVEGHTLPVDNNNNNNSHNTLTSHDQKQH